MNYSSSREKVHGKGIEACAGALRGRHAAMEVEEKVCRQVYKSEDYD